MNAASGRKIVAVFAALGVSVAAAPSRALEDGQDSLINGMAQTFGLVKHEAPQIDYRERSRLVIPPKLTLPPPGRGANGADMAWPTDNETIQARRDKKIEDAEPSALQLSNRDYLLVKPGDDVKVTTSGFNKHGASCRFPDPKTGECPEKARPAMNWNPLTWVGLEKKPAETLGPEPERQNLVEPPKGYRAPAEGVGAKVSN